MERRRQPIVRLLERLHPEPVHVLRRLQPAHRPRAEGCLLDAGVTELLDDVREDVLDGAEGRAGEVEGPLGLSGSRAWARVGR